MAARSAGRSKRAPQVGRRVIFRTPSRNGVAEYLATGLPKPSGGLDCPALLNLSKRTSAIPAHSISAIGREPICGNMSAFKPGKEQRKIPRSQSFALVGKPFARDGLNVFSPASLAARFFAFFTALGSMPSASDARASSRRCAGVRKRHGRINAESESAALSSKSIVQPPIARAVRRDEKVHAAAVTHLICLSPSA